MITLFPDQEKAIGELRASFANGHHSPLLVAPCAFGKTICFTYICAGLTRNRKRSVILVHRDELLEQCAEALRQFDVPHGLISAGSLYDRRLPVHVASVFTLARRLERVEVPDYVICDEAHHCVSGTTWGKVIEYWRAKNPALRLIGVSATPCRLSGEGLGEVFDDMIEGPSTADLIAAGRLSAYRMFAPVHQVDLSGVHSRAGDYVRADLTAVMDKPAIIGSAVGHYRKLCDGMPGVAFCVSVEHAHHVADQFRAAGYRAAAVDGAMDKQLRRDLVRDFARGGINVLTSCSLVDEGFNVPGIVAAIDLSPTQSLSRCIQRWGRALRKAPGKDYALILDHVGNSSRHGMPDDPREWSLLGRDKKGKAADSGPACRQCEKCFAVSPAAAAKCRECGVPFPVKAREIEEVEGSLSEVEVARIKREAARAQAAAETLEDLIRLGQSRGYTNPAGWARHIYQARQARGQR